MERSINRVRARVLTGFFFFVLTCGMAWGQGTAQINGRVTDQSGAVLPGVDVTARQTATAATRSAVTDETGSYVLANLPIGPYMVEVALPGFKTYVQTGIVLQVGANPVVNAVLEVGQVSDQIEVQADAALVETQTSGVGSVIENQSVLELPLNGRNPTELIFLAGAAAPTTDGSLNSGVRNYATVVISVGGGANGGMNYFLDGGSHNDSQNNLNLPLPFPDALQEFKVETSGLAAQYGHHAAGAVNAVTKSGTNDFHGDLFEFLRNGSLNAQNFYAISPDGLKRNQFGGVLGGPIVSNKLFFFGGLQGTLQRATPTVQTAYIPTAKMLAGDFTDFASPACQGGRTVTLRAPFVNNRVNPALFSPQATKLITDPRFPKSDELCGLTNFGGVTNPSEYLMVGKVDYQKSEKQSMFIRFMGAKKDQPADYDGNNLLSSRSGQINQRAYSLVYGHTYLIGSGTVNSLHVTAARTLNPRINPEVIDLSDLGVKNVWIPFKGHMNLGVTNGFTISGVNVQPGFYNSFEGQVADDISWIKGSHQLGVGVYYSHGNFTGSSRVAANPSFSFSGNRRSTAPGVPDGTGAGLSDFLLGLPSGFSAGTFSELYPRQNYFATYIQDSWKATSRLTVNYGVRWEPFIAPYDGHKRHNFFSYELYNSGFRSKTYPKAPMGTKMPGDEGVPKSGKYMHDRWLHFAPRLAFAYDPQGNGLMVIRAAYGIFNDLPPAWTFYGNGSNAPWNPGTSLPNPSFADPWNLPSADFPSGYPGGNPLPSTFTPQSDFPLGDGYDNVREDAHSTYIHQWNLGIQRQVGEDWLFAANYLGNSAIHVWGPQNQLNYSIYATGANTGNISQRRILTLLNPIEGRYYAGIGDLEDGGTSNYNAMLLTVRRRRANGLTVSGNYTWSKCIGDTVVSQPGSGGITPGMRKYNRGMCGGDRTHIANLSTVYETPQFANTAARILGSGWQVSGILKLLSGTTFSVNSGSDTVLAGTSDNNRANQILQDVYLPNRSKDGWLNRNAFAVPTQATGLCSEITKSCGYGNAANSYRGPGIFNFDTGLTRRFQITEGQSLEFRAEAFNVLNHVNPGNPTNTITSQTFGKSTSAADPRIMQLALKYVF